MIVVTVRRAVVENVPISDPVALTEGRCVGKKELDLVTKNQPVGGAVLAGCHDHSAAIQRRNSRRRW